MATFLHRWQDHVHMKAIQGRGSTRRADAASSVLMLTAMLLAGVAGMRLRIPPGAVAPPAAGQDDVAGMADSGLSAIPVALQRVLPPDPNPPRRPPVPINEYRPSAPAVLRERMTNDVEIAVKVYVDETGAVFDAVPLRYGIPVTDDLGTFAADAARRWKFEPARRGAVRAPGQTIVRFRFALP